MEDWLGSGAVGFIAFVLGKYTDVLFKKKESFREDFILLKDSYKENNESQDKEIKQLKEDVKIAKKESIECEKRYNDLKEIMLLIAPSLEAHVREQVYKRFENE